MQDKPSFKTHQNQVDGLVWLLNGDVFVKNELKFGMPAVINPCEGVILYLNGEECNHLTTVSENDKLVLEQTETEQPFSLSVSISDDKLSAHVIYTPPQKVKNIVVDTYPVNKLDIKVTKIVLETKKASKEQLIECLKTEYGIVYGINVDTIENICQNNLLGSILVAQGETPGETTDDFIECFFEESSTDGISLKEDTHGNIDYKNIKSYCVVTQNQVIAQLHNGVPGRTGKAITGEELKARPPKRLTITSTFTAGFNPETGAVTSAKPGRPSQLVKGESISFQIFDSILIDEVSIKTGNIKFKGDIEINKNVLESMEVIAKQNILIKENVSFASIFAGNDIIIKGSVISSKINAAMSDSSLKDPTPLLVRIIESLNKLIDNVNFISSQEKLSQKFKEFHSMVSFLLNTKNKDLPNIIYEVLNVLRKESFDVDEGFLLKFISTTRSLLSNNSEITDVHFLHNIVESLNKLFAERDTSKVKGNVTLGTILNTEVRALGDVTVSGKGCFNSKIFCHGKVVASGDIRGGEIHADKAIEVNTAGSELGVKTLLSVSEQGYIKIGVAHMDTTIKFGNMLYTFLEEKRSVHAKFHEGKIVF